MLKRILKIVLSIPAIIVYLVSGLVTIAINWSIIYAFSSNILDKTCLLLMTPTSIACILFGLSALNLLLLTFYLLCIFKKPKHNNHPQIIEQIMDKVEPEPEKEYIPSEEELKILLLYKGNKSIYPDDLLSISPLSADKTNLCFKNLYDNNFLEIKNEDGEELKYLIQNRLERYRYTLSQKGLEFLNDNKLLD